MYKRAPSKEKRSIFSSGNLLHKQFVFSLPEDFELLFRLSAPEGDDDRWRIEFLLQSKKDPSLMHDLASVMRKDGPAPKGLSLVALGRVGAASKFTAFVPKDMKRPAPLEISPEEAYGFITKDAPSLREADFSVQVPNLTSNPVRPRLLFRMRGPEHLSGRGLSADAVLAFDYKVALGDVVMSPEDFAALSSRKEHLVRLRGKWVEFRPELADKLSGLITGKGPASLPEALSLGLRAAEDGIETGYETEGREVSTFLDLLDQDRRFRAICAPPGFTGKLRPYQERGLGWLEFVTGSGFGALLADDMGLGKTIQVIAFALSKIAQGRRPFLIVCPTSVLGNWAAEFSKFAPRLRVSIHHGTQRQQGKAFSTMIEGSDIIITSYALAWRDAEEFTSVEWAAVVADEAQNLKNPFAKQSTFLKQIRSDLKIALTGTPIENRLSDLWSIMDFLDPGYLPPWPRFKEVFARPIEAQGDRAMTDALVKALAPVLLRRVKSDRSIITDLPDKIEKTEWCYLTPEQATLYKAQVDESLRRLEEKGADRMQVLGTITRLKQICNHPSNFLKDSRELGDRSGKVQRLRELVGSMGARGESCLVFTQYAEMGSLLVEDLCKEIAAPVSYIHGAVPRKERERIIKDFQDPEGTGPRVLVLSLKAGGTGLNLTRASNVVHFDRWWNPAVEDQATDRAFRIGQKRNVMVFKFVTKGTIEERIEEILVSKKALAASVIGSGEALLADLDAGRLRKLMAYRDPD